MSDCIVYKLLHNVRVPVTATVADQPVPLAGKDIRIVHEANGLVQGQNIGAGVTVDGGTGQFSYLMTPAILTALGIASVSAVKTTINIYNADETLLMDGSGVIEVIY